ncbi:unnamed protein product [Prunus armeniaca]|uniref:Wall-associated receptor kinase galacturonan-binding domain-containing protein n=1 Tax=Prunus armeniaca TaxID=36596 RepID=A0A6J5V9X2_PRUAR|nr:unnamed protein product [Prunus armeniaca]
MEKFMFTTTLHTLTLLLLSCSAHSVTATLRCGNCGPTPVPYPLSTGPWCGEPWYRIRCTAGTLWLDALNNSSYAITSINQETQRITIRPASFAPNTCLSSDFHSQGIQLDPNLPFNITSSNTVLLLNCTDAMLNLQAPINCSSNSLCHSFIRDNAVACTRAPLCCTFRTGGSQTAYIIMVYGGGCSAYQSFVNVDGPPSGAVVGVKKTKWPEPGVELEWVSPGGPICKSPVDCKDLLNSKCLVDLSSVGAEEVLLQWWVQMGLHQWYGNGCGRSCGHNGDCRVHQTSPFEEKSTKGFDEEAGAEDIIFENQVMKEERFMDVVDPVIKEGASELDLETMKALGFLAASCLDEQRQNRPSMKEVADEIE